MNKPSGGLGSAGARSPIPKHRAFLFAAAVLAGSFSVGAHDPGLSAATVDLSTREILVQVSFAPADVAALRGSSPADLAERSVELTADSARLQPNSAETRAVGADNVEFTQRFPRPAAGAVTFRSPLLARLPFGHRQALTVRDEAGATVFTEVISADHDFAPLPAKARSAGESPTLTRAVIAASGLAVVALGWLAWPRRVTAAA
jgi:hypothetical protein